MEDGAASATPSSILHPQSSLHPMLYRFSAVLIVAFWLVMTVLLVRLEIAPERSNVLKLPPSHVFNLMFARGQRSELNIFENGQRIGNLMLQPKVAAGENPRVLEFAGSVAVKLFSASRQRVTAD